MEKYLLNLLSEFEALQLDDSSTSENDQSLEILCQLRSIAIVSANKNLDDLVTQDLISLLFTVLEKPDNHLSKYEALWCLINLTYIDHFGPPLLSKSNCDTLLHLASSCLAPPSPSS